MNDPIAHIARAAAGRLTTDATPSLLPDVERALLARDGSRQPETYVIDPVSLGSLIVAVANLAWTVHQDLRQRTPKPAPDVVARTVRVRLRASGATDSPDRDRIIDVVVEEAVRAAEREPT
jgi:hypothetical protein